MEWAEVLTVVIANVALLTGNIGMILWSRAESRSDTRMMLGMIDAIQKEMKDFHGRLCAIEERNKGK